MSVNVFTVLSKGQGVLPAETQRKLSIGSEAKLAVYASGDEIMLKPITVPTEKDFAERLDGDRE